MNPSGLPGPDYTMLRPQQLEKPSLISDIINALELTISDKIRKKLQEKLFPFDACGGSAPIK